VKPSLIFIAIITNILFSKLLKEITISDYEIKIYFTGAIKQRQKHKISISFKEDGKAKGGRKSIQKQYCGRKSTIACFLVC
jgi:hypothetical protein